jgi:hypothetical protein
MKTITQKDLDNFQAALHEISRFSQLSKRQADAALANIRAIDHEGSTEAVAKQLAGPAKVLADLEGVSARLLTEFKGHALNCFGMRPDFGESDEDFRGRVSSMDAAALMGVMHRNGISVSHD